MEEATTSVSRIRTVSEERRSHIRIPQAELHCSLGRVQDLSRMGLRVSCRRMPKDAVAFELNTTVDPLAVQAEVVWSKRLGFRKHEVGMRFVEPDSGLAKLVSCCSTFGDDTGWESA